LNGNTKLKLPFILCLFALLAAMAAGCDPVTRHKVLTTIFDGVPSCAPPEEILEEYYQNRIAAELEQGQTGDEAGPEVARIASYHKPFKEKKCKDCHDFTTDIGLIRPLRELCFVCHRDFLRHIKEPFVHGPVAVGDCSACHLPHTSVNSSLLEMEKSKLCGKCHQEQRLAASMHERVMTHGMACSDCHDPHYGKVHYFLK
jgi:predicted CXXCH cytochrome family protein